MLLSLLRPAAFLTAVTALLLLAPFGFFLAAVLPDTGFLDKAVQLFSQQAYIEAAINTIVIGVSTALICGIAGTIQALILQREEYWRIFPFKQIFFLPFLLPTYITVILWARFFSVENTGGLHDFFFSPAGVIFVLSLHYLPVTTAIIWAGLVCLPRDPEDAARLVHPWWKTFFHVTLPRLFPQVVRAALLVLIMAMANFDVADILRVRVVPVEIFIEFSVMYDEAGAFLLVLPYVVLPMVTIVLLNRRHKGQDRSTHGRCNHARPGYSEGRTVRIVSTAILSCLLLLSLVIPLAMLLDFANLSQAFSVLTSSLEEIGYSLFLGLLTACSAVCISLPAGYFLARKESPARLVQSLFFLPFAIPGIFIGMTFIRIGNSDLFYALTSGSSLCVAAMVCHFLFIALIIMQFGIKLIPLDQEYSAAVFGLSGYTIFRRLLLPQLKGAIAAAFCIIFVLSFGDLSTTLLIVPPGKETFSAKIYNIMHYGSDETVATLCLVATGIIVFFYGSALLWKAIMNRHFFKSRA